MVDWQTFAAHFEELELEEMLLDLRAKGWMPKTAESVRVALVWIDERAVAGDLSAQRDQLRVEAGEHPLAEARASLSSVDWDAVELFGRLTAGLLDPDPERRGEVEDLARRWGFYEDEPLAQIARKAAILARPEAPPGKRGRRELSPPWRAKAAEMEAMRLLVSKGFTAREAAVEASRDSAGRRVGYLVQLFEMKASLRK